MRIRLQVQRHQLPPAKILWNTEGATTTVELLTQINDFFPLEAEGWGLEDYAVRVGGYELLHFQPIESLLKDDDEVVIQPLQTNDIRARNISGRHQISHDGRHLVDGIAYGRPLLRTPSRPPVRIPPRKRIRLSDDQPFQEASTSQDWQPCSEQELDAIYDEAFRDASPETQALIRGFTAADNERDPVAGRAVSRDSGRHLRGPRDDPQKHVSFLEDHEEGDDSESDDDEDYEPLINGGEDEDDDDESDISEDASPKLIERATKGFVDESESESESESEASSSSDESSSDDEAPSEQGIKQQPPSVSVPPPPSSSMPVAEKRGIPHEGKNSTRARNRRRRDAKKLNWLKSKGILPQNANREALAKWKEQNAQKENDSGSGSDSDSDETSSDSSSDDDSDSESEVESEREPVVAAEPSPAPAKPQTMIPRQLKVKPKKPVSEEKTEAFKQKREALLAALQSGGVDINQDLSATATPDDTTPVNASEKSTPSAEMVTSAQAETRRARLDLAGSRRMLFGSLGVRTPKTEADRQRLQEKLAQDKRKPITKPTPPQSAPQTEEDEPTDPDAWKSKISLSAVECMPGFEEHYYSTPPFPFHQRWDPSQRTKKRKRASQGFSASKAPRTLEDMYDEYSESYNEGNGGDALDYDDETPAEGAAEEFDQEAVSAQLLSEISPEDDFPRLPSDLTTLPSLTPDAAVTGAIICFSRLEVSAATNWAPAMSPIRTALIRALHDQDNVLELQLAKRDQPKKEFDEQGRRVFDKFEMITGDEDEEGILEVGLGELVDARLLVAAEGDENMVDGDAVAVPETEVEVVPENEVEMVPETQVEAVTEIAMDVDVDQNAMNAETEVVEEKPQEGDEVQIA